MFGCIRLEMRFGCLDQAMVGLCSQINNTSIVIILNIYMASSRYPESQRNLKA